MRARLPIVCIVAACWMSAPPGPVARAAPPAAEGATTASARIEVEPLTATVGERIDATLTIVLPSDVRLEPPILGPQLGSFTVNEGAWAPADRQDDRIVWTWRGTLSAYRTGTLEIPAVTVRIRPDADDPRGGAARTLDTEPVAVEVVSVLDDSEGAAGADATELADLKPPAAVPPDFRALRTAAGILLLLSLGAVVAWWLLRRYAERLAAAKLPDDPFHRTPPHVWVYGQLQELLERKLPERGRVEEFYAKLAAILKRYLTGRYRVELMERTTGEVPDALCQAGAPDGAIEDTAALLVRCDMVKFAQNLPGASEWKAAVEEVYRIVDGTKPLMPSEARESRDVPAAPEQGAA